MPRHPPPAVRPLERGDCRLSLEEDLGQHIDHAPGGVFVADRKADAVGGGGEGVIHRRSTAFQGEHSGDTRGTYRDFPQVSAPIFHTRSAALSRPSRQFLHRLSTGFPTNGTQPPPRAPAGKTPPISLKFED